MIPVSTLVSGIDNGPIHLGPLKLAWRFKGEDGEPGRTRGAEEKDGWVGGGRDAGGERSFWHVTKQNMFEGAT